MKLAAFFLALSMVGSVLSSSSSMAISVGPNKKEVFMTGQVCKSDADCKANSVYSGNFCINKMSGSQIGHCAGFGSTLALSILEGKESKAKKKGGCGKCKTDEDCRGCPAVAACEKIILDGYCA